MVQKSSSREAEAEGRHIQDKIDRTERLRLRLRAAISRTR
jgi:hypothetical protein